MCFGAKINEMGFLLFNPLFIFRYNRDIPDITEYLEGLKVIGDRIKSLHLLNAPTVTFAIFYVPPIS